MAWIGDRQDGMIQENCLDTDRGIVKVAERKFPGRNERWWTYFLNGASLSLI